MQGSFKTSEASSNHVLFTKQKGVRQIHSSCQKKTNGIAMHYCINMYCHQFHDMNIEMSTSQFEYTNKIHQICRRES